MKIKVAFDLDGCITSYPQLISILTQALSSNPDVEIIILTAREPSKESYTQTKVELDEMRIYYHKLIITDEKQKYIRKNGVKLFLDNQDENFQGLGPGVCCMKIREEGNYDYSNFKWLFSDRTGKMI